MYLSKAHYTDEWFEEFDNFNRSVHPEFVDYFREFIEQAHYSIAI